MEVGALAQVYGGGEQKTGRTIDRLITSSRAPRCTPSSAGACGCKKLPLEAMDYQPVVVQRHPKSAPAHHSTESRHWRQFKHPVFVKEYAPVTSIHFSVAKPHRYAVTAATRVQIYASRTQKVTKTISRFKDVARSGHIRQDGKLVIGADDTGLIQVSRRLIYCLHGV